MTPERHRQISELFHAAQAVEPAARAALVEAASLGDAELQREVTALLAAYPHAEEFLAALALESGGAERTETPSLVGHRVAHYDVVALLGAGGMGEVYRARDARLGRDVAIKVLPDAFTRDAARVARFEREARVLASLNHPHIAALYGLEESDDRTFLVMELVEGPTLDERLAQGSQLKAHGSGLPQEEALHLAQQIAEALEAAHEKGIVHRDLKPGNVKVTPDNNVKLLDFGLAKGLADADVNVSNSPTLTAMATHAGVIMGTPAYMSPEQAKGGAVDRRTDIFAFGCLLYEMLTGRRAFEGDSESEIVARVIEREPDWKALPPALHPRIHELLRRCLEKDPKKRRRDIADVRMEIEQVLSGPAQTVAPPVDSASRHRARLAWTVSTILAVALVATVAWPFFSRTAGTPETRVDISTPETPEPEGFAISPDGRRLVFVALRNGQAQLSVRSLDAETAQPLSGTEGARLPFWSSDGRSIGFFARSGELKRIDLAGGRLQTLAQAVPGLGGTWGPDGTIVFAPTQTGPLFRVPASGGESVGVTTLGPGQSAHGFPSLLPGGRQFLFYVAGTVDVRGIYLGSLDSPDTTRLTDADTPGAYAPSGWLLFARQGALVARRFDLSRREMNGDPVTVAESVAANVAFSVSATGVIAYRTGDTTPRQLTWFDRSGQLLGTLGEPDRADLLNAALSPDGRQAAVQRRVENNVDIWLVDSARTTRFTFDPGLELYPTWSHDGNRIAFAGSRADLYQRVLSAASSDELLLASPRLKFPSDWSADGRFLLYFEINTKAQPDLWVLPMDGDRKPFPFLSTSFSESWGEFSPNRQLVAYQSNESGQFEIYVRPFPPPGGQWRVSTSGGVYPRWSPDGKEVYYLAPDGTLMAAAVTAKGATLDVGVPATLFRTRIVGGGAFLVGGRQQYDVDKDGRFLINVEIGSAPPPITLVFNWKPPVNRD